MTGLQLLKKNQFKLDFLHNYAQITERNDYFKIKIFPTTETRDKWFAFEHGYSGILEIHFNYKRAGVVVLLYEHNKIGNSHFNSIQDALCDLHSDCKENSLTREQFLSKIYDLYENLSVLWL